MLCVLAVVAGVVVSLLAKCETGTAFKVAIVFALVLACKEENV